MIGIWKEVEFRQAFAEKIEQGFSDLKRMRRTQRYPRIFYPQEIFAHHKEVEIHEYTT